MSPSEGEVAKLRELLGSAGRDDVAQVERRVEEHVVQHRTLLARDLPAALTEMSVDGDENPLAPLVNRALLRSIEVDPAPIIDALTPIMGHAIRKHVSMVVTGLVQSFNNALEVSVSPRAIAWRFEAWRTGHTFAEVALLKSLIYRVEQVFVIHRETGIVLLHTSAPAVVFQDADIVSGMLTAIQDFVHDSFASGDTDELDSLQVGPLQVWVERTPRVACAAVIRGQAPVSLRYHLQEVLQEVTSRYSASLVDFDGDVDRFVESADLLDSCLDEQQREATPSPWPARILGILVLALVLGIIVTRCMPEKEVELAPEDPWAAYVAELRTTPGLVVVDLHPEREGLFLTGLRDPLAADPDLLMDGHPGVRSRVRARWGAFVSLEPALVERRARQALKPPEGVEIVLSEEVLRIRGRADRRWILRAEQIAPLLPGVGAVSTKGLVDIDAERLQALREELEAIEIDFEIDSSQPAAKALARANELLAELEEVAEPGQIVALVGHRHATDTSARDRTLWRQRGDSVHSELQEGRVNITLQNLAGGLAGMDVSPAGDRRITLDLRP